MVDKLKWFDRVFDGSLPEGLFPMIVERLRGTPVRIDETIRLTPAKRLVEQVDGAWSIQENLGHLIDLEPLWSGRLEDLLANKPELRPADLTNLKTHEANHNASSIEELAHTFREIRTSLVNRFDSLTDEEVRLRAHHPRLDTPMRMIDLCFFMAEHDDFHLTRMTEIRRALSSR
ncbi:MAG: DinB family protein [bacterium]|nr:DinB family protein [bacterium]